MSQLDEVLAVAANNTAGVFRLSPETLAVFAFAYSYLADLATWKDFADEQLSTADQDTIAALIDNAMREIMQPLIGWIIPYVSSALPDYMLPCEGDLYAAGDYPDLYAILPAGLKVVGPPAFFYTPDLRDRFPKGVIGAEQIGVLGGEKTVTLTAAQIPAHTHGQNLLNNVIARVFGAGSGGSSIGSTATSSAQPQIQTSAAGGGEAHNNMPLYCTVRYAIVAR